MNSQELHDIFKAIGLALSSSHGLLVTDIEDGEQWVLDNSKEIEGLELIKKYLGIKCGDCEK